VLCTGAMTRVVDAEQNTSRRARVLICLFTASDELTVCVTHPCMLHCYCSSHSLGLSVFELSVPERITVYVSFLHYAVRQHGLHSACGNEYNISPYRAVIEHYTHHVANFDTCISVERTVHAVIKSPIRRLSSY